MGFLDGKVAVVTGAGRGLGREYALALAKEGAKVVVNDTGCNLDGSGRDKTVADMVVEEILSLGGTGVPSYESVASAEGAEKIMDTAMKSFGRLDILINNAGIIKDRTILKMSDEEWDEVLNVILRGTFFCIRSAGRIMKSQGGGRIINTSALTGVFGNYGQANYSSACAGIIGLTKTAAIEFARYGITVNCVMPVALTRMTRGLPAFKGVKEEEFSPSLCTPLILYLCSDRADWITGYTFGICGGKVFVCRTHITKGVKRKVWTQEGIHESIRKILEE